MRTCARCKQKLRMDAFGVNRANPSGRNIYCKSCNCAISTEHKKRKREYVQAHNVMGRKRRYFSPVDKVEQAIVSGAGTRPEIKRAARLPMGITCDALAYLMSRQRIKCRTINGERLFVATEAA